MSSDQCYFRLINWQLYSDCGSRYLAMNVVNRLDLQPRFYFFFSNALRYFPACAKICRLFGHCTMLSNNHCRTFSSLTTGTRGRLTLVHRKGCWGHKKAYAWFNLLACFLYLWIFNVLINKRLWYIHSIHAILYSNKSANNIVIYDL